MDLNEVIEKINNLDNITIVRGNCDADVDQMVIKHPIESPFVHKKIDNINMSFLSMGMSGDYETAVKYGSNILRIGSALFGARIYR